MTVLLKWHFQQILKSETILSLLITLPANTGAAGNYEVPISYTRTNFAAAATHLASIHSRESRYMERSEELTLYLLEKEAQIKHLEARVTKLEEN